MILDTRQMTAEQCYRLMTGVIVPRPIAWVTTLSAAGVVNLAPFSHFTFVAPKPPMVALSFGRKGTHYKDTTHNILASEEFVVHIARSSHVAAVHDSAIDFPSDTSEVAELGLATLPSTEVKPPRLADTPIAMECRLRHCIELGESRNRLIIGEVILLHFADGVLENGKIDSRKLDPLCRLAGPHYAALGEIMTMTPIGQRAKTPL